MTVARVFGMAARIAAGALILTGLLLASARADEDPAFVKLSAGAIGLLPSDRNKAGYFGLEFIGGPSLDLWHIRPSIGVGLSMDATAYGYTALNLDIYFGPRLVLTPSVGIGLYHTGSGQDLGSVLEFRNGAELAWRFDDRSRLGLGFHYLSNFGIGDSDPGTSTLTVFYAHPLGWILPP
jgi:lipid A 3-O-deacylase